MKIISFTEIQSRINLPQMIVDQEEGFKAYSAGQVNVPPVGHIRFDNPLGDCHIKYGAITNDEVFVVKIASSFGTNQSQYGISACQGLMLVLSSKTGEPLVLLQDNGYLTELRTAIAGLIAAKYLAPKVINGIGVLGTGGQARMQIEMLKNITPCRTLWVWGRNSDNTASYTKDITDKGFTVHVVEDPATVAQNCNIIVSTTPSKTALLEAKDVRPGTHITAMGADSPNKQELDPELFRKAHICVVDSKSQCIDHGDSHYAIRSGCILESQLIEIGQIIINPTIGRTHDNQITLADLTGVAVQDIQIAKFFV